MSYFISFAKKLELYLKTSQTAHFVGPQKRLEPFVQFNFRLVPH